MKKTMLLTALVFGLIAGMAVLVNIRLVAPEHADSQTNGGSTTGPLLM